MRKCNNTFHKNMDMQKIIMLQIAIVLHIRTYVKDTVTTNVILCEKNKFCKHNSKLSI